MDDWQCCRTCLGVRNLNLIFLMPEHSEKYSEVILAATGIKVELNDSLPQHMCSPCISFINNTYKFRKRCEETQNVLQARLNPKPTYIIKIEPNLSQADEVNIIDISNLVDDDFRGYNDNFALSEFNIEIDNNREFEVNIIDADTMAKKREEIAINIGNTEPVKEKCKEFDINIKNAKSIEEKCKEIDINVSNVKPMEEKCNEIHINVSNAKPVEEKRKQIDINVNNAKLIQKKRNEFDINFSNAKPVREKCKEIDIIYSNAKPAEEKREEFDINITKDKHVEEKSEELAPNIKKVQAIDEIEIKASQKSPKSTDKTAKKRGRTKKENQEEKRTKEKKARVKEEIHCELCHKVLTSKLSLRNHYKIHTGFDVVCEHCGKKFITRRLLLMHCKAKHGYEKTDKCSFCDYRASNAEQVKIHERLHTGEKPYVCGDCGAGFHRRSSYLQHVAIHLPEKTVQCDQCPALFKSVTLMRIHRNRHRPARYTYKCRVCDNNFARRRNVVRHLLRIHSLQAASEHIDRTRAA